MKLMESTDAEWAEVAYEYNPVGEYGFIRGTWLLGPWVYSIWMSFCGIYVGLLTFINVLIGGDWWRVYNQTQIECNNWLGDMF